MAAATAEYNVVPSALLPGKARYAGGLLAHNCVSSSGAPSTYVKYALVRSSLLPCSASRHDVIFCLFDKIWYEERRRAS